MKKPLGRRLLRDKRQTYFVLVCSCRLAQRWPNVNTRLAVLGIKECYYIVKTMIFTRNKAIYCVDSLVLIP